MIVVRDQKGYDAILTIGFNLIVGCCCCFSDGTLNPAGVRFGSAEIYNIGEESCFSVEEIEWQYTVMVAGQLFVRTEPLIRLVHAFFPL